MKTQTLKKQYGRIIVLQFIIASCCTSCFTSRVYAPVSHNIPCFEQQHDFSFSASRVHSGYSTGIAGISLQGAYAPLPQIGVILNYSNLIEVGEESHRFKNFETGAGYFKELVPKLIFETYLGGGIGRMGLEGYVSDTKIIGSMRNRFLFLQPSLSYKTEYFEMLFSVKSSFIDFYDLQHNAEQVSLSNLNKSEHENFLEQRKAVETIAQHGTYTVYEPRLTLRAGIQDVKLELQFGTSLMSDQVLREQSFRNFSSLGLRIALNGKKRQFNASVDQKM